MNSPDVIPCAEAVEPPDLAGRNAEGRRFQTIFEQIADAVLVARLDGRIIEVNRAACALLGYTREELLTLRPWDFVTTASRAEILQLYQTLEPGKASSVERVCRRKDGELRVIDLRLTRFSDENGEQVVVCCRDTTEHALVVERLRVITERQKTERELQRVNAQLEYQTAQLRQANLTLTENEQRLRLAIETGKIGLWVWNSADIGNPGDWSPRLKEIFGLPPQVEVTHDLFLKCVHPEDRTRVNDLVLQALHGANGGQYSTEYRTIHPGDDAPHWVTARGQAFVNAEGQTVRFIGTVMDITELKRAEQSLRDQNLTLGTRIAERTCDLERINRALQTEIDDRRRAEERLQRSEAQLAEAQKLSVTGSFSWRPESGEAIWSDETYRIYGYKPELKPTVDIAIERIHPEDRSRVRELMADASREGKDVNFEHRLLLPDGGVKHLHVVARIGKDASGSVEFIGAVMDVTERKRAAHALLISEHLARGQLNALTHTLASLAPKAQPDAFLEQVLRTIGRQLDAHSIAVWERNEITRVIQLIADCEGDQFRFYTESNGYPAPVWSLMGEHPVWTEFLRDGKHCVLGEADTNPPRVRFDAGPDTPWYPWAGDAASDPLTAMMMKRFAAQGIVSSLYVPMFIAGKVTGTLSIRFQRKRTFRREEIELTRALAHQAVLAIHLMRLSRQSRHSAVIEERNRLARDIHDTLAQGFTGVIVQLEAAEDAKSKALTSEFDDHLARASGLAREGLREARRSLQALRPHALEKMILREALEHLLQKMTAGTKLRAHFAWRSEVAHLPSHWEENLLRIAQEVLTNALRHAQADRFEVRVSSTLGSFLMELSDNGVGFDPSSKHDGFGLLGIRERVETMGGRLELLSTKAEGTSIRIAVPMSGSLSSTSP